MRIISGYFRGRKILEPIDIKTRPLKDLTKESIFNLINHSNKFDINIKSSIVLDLFSGVGSFGIECLSRGAKEVVFVENYTNALNVLKKNLENLKIFENYKILEFDIYNNIKILKNFKQFDIIFLDPPYKDKNLYNLFLEILNNNLLKRNGILILHRHKNEEDNLPSDFKILVEKKYGISRIKFYSLD